MAIVAPPAPANTGFSVDQLARDYATGQLRNQQLGQEERQLLLKRITYDAKVTAFNAATIAATITLAITIITNSIVPFVLFAACYLVRNAIGKSIDLTGLDFDVEEGLAAFVTAEFVARISNIMGANQRREAVTQDLEIEGEEWQPDYRLLDFVVWKYWTPRADLQQQEAQGLQVDLGPVDELENVHGFPEQEAQGLQVDLGPVDELENVHGFPAQVNQFGLFE